MAVRPRAVAKTTMMRVVEGDMCAMQVKVEMERLVPAKMSWAAEEIERNVFKTIFSSKGEMQWMMRGVSFKQKIVRQNWS
jgi:hypothetical protein